MLAPVNATDYVQCWLGPAPGISTPTDPPRAVEVIAGIHQAGTGAGNMEIRLRDGNYGISVAHTLSRIYTATAVAGNTAVQYKRAHFAEPPSAATAWVIGGAGDGDFNNLRVIFGSPAALDVDPDQYFDGLMIEAEFAEVVSAQPFHLPRKERKKFWNYMKRR